MTSTAPKNPCTIVDATAETCVVYGRQCGVCGEPLQHHYIQARSDNEPATLVIKCPTHGIYRDLCSKYYELESNRMAEIGSTGPE